MQRPNKGSATLEAVLIMPIILIVIVMVIYLFFDCINDSTVRARMYELLYTYSEMEGPMDENVNEAVNDVPVGNGENSAVWGRDKHGIYVKTRGMEISANGSYGYVSDSMTYRTEYDQCADRLRRWQLYGDILWE